MSKQPKHNVWIGTENVQNNADLRQAADKEFSELPVVDAMSDDRSMDLSSTRRDFLKYLGFGVGTAALAAGCDIPVKKAMPYVMKPDAVVPGVATYYASTFVQGGDYCPVLVKTREGRPIKIEGNTSCPLTGGGTSARAQASVLSLYDISRLDGPYRILDGDVDGRASQTSIGPSWDVIDAEIMEKLRGKRNVRVLSHTILSPTGKKAIQEFLQAFPGSKHVMYDPISYDGMLRANEETFGQRALPAYHFDKADVIVGIGADFLGTWISPVEYARQYIQNRKIKDEKKARMSRHIQIESYMSLTGSNADQRVLIKPSATGAAIVALYNAIVGGSGGPGLDGTASAEIKAVAQELRAANGRALVVSGSNNYAEQILVNAINQALGSYGNTITWDRPSYQRQGDDRALTRLVKEMESGRVDAIILLDTANPAYDTPLAARFAAAMDKVTLKVGTQPTLNESLVLCDYACPNHHYLESWGDAEPKAGVLALIQPTIQPIWAAVGRSGTRNQFETLLRWADSARLDKNASQPYLEYLRAQWQGDMFNRQSALASFNSFWDASLHDGIVVMDSQAAPASFSDTSAAAKGRVSQPASTEMELAFFETVNMGGGIYANNPWLMEMPDPVTRCSWGNYLTVPVEWNGDDSWSALNGLGKKEYKGTADIVEVTAGDRTERCTAVRQFGQMPGTVGLAVGYGRDITGYQDRALGENFGTNAYPWLSYDENGNVRYYITGASVSNAVGQDKQFACVQYHHTMGVTAKTESGETLIDESTGKPVNVDEYTANALPDPFNKWGFQGGIVDRSIIFQGTLDDLAELEHTVEHRREEAHHLNEQTLYPYDEYKKKDYNQGHHWAMHIDLNACTGCGACQIACVAENNVPVVGKREVSRHHEMTWLRIDRYYYGDYKNPNVVYQPMMCQHCDNAPCENVCPVAATNHSSEGLNQMTYNRCIGTRYCANNCPYKVRRFNWLDYTTADLFAYNEPHLAGEEIPFGADNLTRMVLNPDVTVRSRGVIEKCSFCVQRIQEGKLTAKYEGRMLKDGDVKTACQTACGSGAIVFGDTNDKESVLAERLKSPLNYRVLEETNTQSSIYYKAKVINRKA